jgi:5'-nucleotidase (lipoprotein e(P4) family)
VTPPRPPSPLDFGRAAPYACGMLRVPPPSTFLLVLLLPTFAAAQAPAATTDAATRARESTLAVAWMQRSAEYRAACLQAFRSAEATLASAIENPTWTACLEQGDRATWQALPPAVVVDVDETMLDNSAFAARNVQAGQVFTPASWAAWVKEQQALPVPGALAYAHAAQGLGARVVYVTNRKADAPTGDPAGTQESDTRANLKRLGFPIVEADGEDVVLTAGEYGDKAARRAKVAEGFRIVQIVGDNLGDFAPGTERSRQPDETPATVALAAALAERNRGATADAFAAWWGERWILIPNPGYGGFEDLLRDQFANLPQALRPQR